MANRVARVGSLPWVSAWVLLVSACGGGGGSGGPQQPTPTDLDRAAAQYGIDPSGVGGDGAGDGGAAGAAGDGAPLRRAAVSLTDARGNQVRGSTDEQGKFLLRYRTASFTAPLVLRVTDAGGNVLASVTDESAAAGKVIRASINPLTDKIASDAIAPSVAGTDKAFDGSKVDTARLPKAKTDLVSSVRAALAVAGVSDSAAFDPVKSVYSYDGTGVDLVIESIAHARDPVSGATQLRAKLAGVQTQADGSAGGLLISASTPLPADLVALPTNPTLGFGKLAAWVNEVNRCLALAGAQRAADVDCVDADGSRLVSKDYRNDSADLREDLAFLDATQAAQGNVVRHPLVLFTSKFPGSSATFDDMAVVEVTLTPAGGAAGGETVRTLVFKRNDSLTRAKAGNWILHGNQNRYESRVAPVYFKHRQLNPTPLAGARQTKVESSLDLLVRNRVFDASSRSWRNADIRAVRVSGPGLPTAGLVLASAPDDDYLGLINKTGSVPAVAASSVGPVTYFLASSTPAGVALPEAYTAAAVDRASPMLSDFAPMQAYGRYRFEFFLGKNTSAVADAVEYAYNLATVAAPQAVPAMLDNDLTPSTSLLTVPAPGGDVLTALWTNNANAQPVWNVQIYATQRDARGVSFGFGQTRVPAPSAAGVRVSSQAVKASLSTLNGVTQATSSFPALADAARDSRAVNIRTNLARTAQIVNWLDWN